jgi:hypothetical protein
MTPILFLICLFVLSLVLRRMWLAGDIKGFSPKTREERNRFYWVAAAAVNFLAFIAHVLSDGTCAFPSGGHLVGNYYFVPCHGKEVAFTQTGYAFSYWHGLIFVLIHVVCTIAIWSFRKKPDSGTEV